MEPFVIEAKSAGPNMTLFAHFHQNYSASKMPQLCLPETYSEPKMYRMCPKRPAVMRIRIVMGLKVLTDDRSVHTVQTDTVRCV